MPDGKNERTAGRPRFLDHYHLEVGRVASAWAFLEFEIDQFIWELAGVEERAGACITTQLTGISARLRSAIALLHLRGAEEATVKSFKSFEGRIQEVLSARNRAVHDGWAISGTSAAQMRVAIVKKQLEYGPHRVRPDDLLKTRHDINKARRQFRALAVEALARCCKPT